MKNFWIYLRSFAPVSYTHLRVELGYNRHSAKRKIELNKTYENKADYNTYSVSIDNKLSKTIYTDPVSYTHLKQQQQYLILKSI